MICDADSGSADRLLTLDFGRYLLDAGVTPLLHPAIRGSRREIPRPAPSPLFYAEAKQYQATNPGALVRRAYDRLWGTWRRLRRLYRFDEAFLVVFCRRGRLVELPIEVDLGGLTIYSASVDLSDTADHPERASTIRFSAVKLRRSLP